MPSLTAKAEQALKSYLLWSLPDPPPILTGRATVAPVSPPHITISCLTANDPEDIPSAVGTLALGLSIAIETPLGGDDGGTVSADHDALLQCIASALDDRENIQARLNKPTTGADTRPIVGFHLHNIRLEQSGGIVATDRSTHLTSLSYQLVATNNDA